MAYLADSMAAETAKAEEMAIGYMCLVVRTASQIAVGCLAGGRRPYGALHCANRHPKSRGCHAFVCWCRFGGLCAQLLAVRIRHLQRAFPSFDHGMGEIGGRYLASDHML